MDARSAAPGTRRPRGAADRVRLAQRQVRWSLPLAALFGGVAVAAVAFDERWAALHLVLAGGVVLLISAVSLLLTVTWSAAPAPSDRLVALQRAAVALGVAALVAGRQADAPSWVPVGGAALYSTGLVALAVLLAVTVRRGVERRFDLVVAGYVVALTAGVGGAGAGAALVAGRGSAGLHDAHLVLNLLGFVGIVVSSTLPPFAATVVRSKVSPAVTRARVLSLLGWHAVAIAVAVVGALSSSGGVLGVGLGADALGIVATAALLPPPTRRQLTWAGPRLVGLWAGTAWWALSVGAFAAAALRDRPTFGDRWLAVLLLPAYGQIVWGSLAYLVPVLRGGGHERLAAGFARTRSWPGLVLVNVAGVAIVAGQGTVAACAGTLWGTDTALRLAAVATDRLRHRPGGSP